MGTVTGVTRQTGKGPYRHMKALWKGAIALTYAAFVFRDTGDSNSSGQNYDKPVSQGTFGAGTHSQAQVAAKAVFQGIAETRRTTLQTADGTDTTDGGILATGEFTSPCSALGSAAQKGAFVGIAQGTGGAQTLSDANVEIVNSASNAIGILTEFAPVGQTFLTYQLIAAAPEGGVQAIV